MIHLVTGGAGFVGSQVVRALAVRGERVRILDRIEPAGAPAGVEVVRGDLLDGRVVADALEGVDTVHHHAALVPVTKAGAEFRRVNADGTALLLAAARKKAVKFFVHVSSSAVFGIPAECPITEGTPPRPVEDYGRSKLEAEGHVERAARDGLRCAIVRPRTVIGPGRLGIFKILYEWIAEGRKIWVIGDGSNRFQFIDVDDLVAALLAVTERRATGVYNVGAEPFGTLRDDLGGLIRHAGSKSRVVGVPAPLARALLRALDRLGLSPLGPYHYTVYSESFHFDLSPAKQRLGWKPRWGNVESLTRSYDWFVAERGRLAQGGEQSTHRTPAREGLLGVLRRIS
jgi:nucleoside-diphosphate-sugar epimerase